MDNMNDLENQSPFVVDAQELGKNTKAVPKPETNIGIDTGDTLFQNIVSSGEASSLDMSQVEAFTRVSQNREQVYRLIDSMCEDPTVSAVLETYAEDATEYNDQGKIVWAESADSEIGKYITFLLDSLNVDKHIYGWVYSLCKYGDLYLRLFRESEVKDAFFDSEDDSNVLNEDINIISFSKNDRFVNYIERVPNPAEMFELTKFGKTYGFIKADADTFSKENNWQNATYRYKFKKKDIDIYSAKEFVHACLEDNSSRNPEEVNIFVGETDEETDSYAYTVRRGQSLLYNVFKVWRQLMLLKNSVLLNRLTKSSVVRVVSVEVADMPKAQVEHRLRSVKNLIEQKSAFNEGKSMSEYTNPGPIENNVYVATRNGVGAVSTSQIGGDVDVKSLADLEYFNNEFYGALRVPKQYFGWTDDATGFNGGTSLSIISSRYAKMIKRIQNTVIQAITDIVNLLLIDRGLGNYVNKFTIHMLPPTTQEEIDRRDNMSSKVQLASDIMNMLSDIEDPVAKLKIIKSLIVNIISDTDIVDILQGQIDAIESSISEESSEDEQTTDETEDDTLVDLGDSEGEERTPEMGAVSAEGETKEQPEEVTGDLPSPDELGIDFTANQNF